MTWPKGMVSLTFETSTQKGPGTERTVVSTKRMTFADYERGLLSDSVAAVDTRLTAALAAQNADLVRKNTALEAGGGSPVGVVALVVSILALCAGGGALATAG